MQEARRLKSQLKFNGSHTMERDVAGTLVGTLIEGIRSVIGQTAAISQSVL